MGRSNRLCVSIHKTIIVYCFDLEMNEIDSSVSSTSLGVKITFYQPFINIVCYFKHLDAAYKIFCRDNISMKSDEISFYVNCYQKV